jgi:ABC-type bacteriocin/lantibiotic exporter with double-glycine peptidase domain
MAAGIVLIFAGVLIAIYPPLLSIIVATVLIVIGIVIVSIAHFDRKLQRHHENPAIELFFRF